MVVFNLTASGCKQLDFVECNQGVPQLQLVLYLCSILICDFTDIAESRKVYKHLQVKGFCIYNIYCNFYCWFDVSVTVQNTCTCCQNNMACFTNLMLIKSKSILDNYEYIGFLTLSSYDTCVCKSNDVWKSHVPHIVCVLQYTCVFFFYAFDFHRWPVLWFLQNSPLLKSFISVYKATFHTISFINNYWWMKFYWTEFNILIQLTVSKDIL